MNLENVCFCFEFATLARFYLSWICVLRIRSAVGDWNRILKKIRCQPKLTNTHSETSIYVSSDSHMQRVSIVCGSETKYMIYAKKTTTLNMRICICIDWFVQSICSMAWNVIRKSNRIRISSIANESQRRSPKLRYFWTILISFSGECK